MFRVPVARFRGNRFTTRREMPRDADDDGDMAVVKDHVNLQVIPSINSIIFARRFAFGVDNICPCGAPVHTSAADRQTITRELLCPLEIPSGIKTIRIRYNSQTDKNPSHVARHNGHFIAGAFPMKIPFAAGDGTMDELRFDLSITRR